MIEGFKLTALKLKRSVKVSVSLPEDYNYTNKSFPLLLCLDGQDYFNFILENTLKVDLPKIIKEKNKSLIAIGIQAPKIPEWRISELNAFYNGSNTAVEKDLATIFCDYLGNDLIPLLKGKYRISDIYILGSYESAIQALISTTIFDSIKGCYFLSPKLNDCDMDILKEYLLDNYHKESKYHLYLGGSNSTTDDLNNFMAIYTTLDHLKCSYIDLLYEENKGNEYLDLEEHISEIIDKDFQ